MGNFDKNNLRASRASNFLFFWRIARGNHENVVKTCSNFRKIVGKSKTTRHSEIFGKNKNVIARFDLKGLDQTLPHSLCFFWKKHNEQNRKCDPTLLLLRVWSSYFQDLVYSLVPQVDQIWASNSNYFSPNTWMSEIQLCRAVGEGLTSPFKGGGIFNLPVFVSASASLTKKSFFRDFFSSSVNI